MDLLASIRKEGSRGGRANFKWEDVQTDQHRENYLGHSLKAPVGRWQKNRDLGWYANADQPEVSAAEQRKEEIRRIKEAEQDALSAALGFAPTVRKLDGAGVSEAEVRRVVGETNADDDGEVEGGKGVGFGAYGGGLKVEENGKAEVEREVLDGEGGGDGGLRGARAASNDRRERGGYDGRERIRSPERRRERRKRNGSRERRSGRHETRDKEHRSRRSRSRSGDRDRERRYMDHGLGHRRHRSRSPYREQDNERHRRNDRDYGRLRR